MHIGIVKIGSFLPSGGIEEYSRMFCSESLKLGHTTDVISVAIGQNFKKPKQLELLNGLKYTEFNINHIEEFKSRINQYDTIILMNSYVTTLKDIRTQKNKVKVLDECWKFFECYRNANAYKILQNHYGPEKYTARTPYMLEYMLESNKVMGHSDNDRFYQLCKLIRVPFVKIKLFVDFNEFNGDFEKNKSLKYVGRGSSLKGFQHIPKMSQQLCDAGIRIDMHGMTRDMSVYQKLLKFDDVCYLGQHKSDKTTIYAWGQYSKSELTNILSDAMFVFAPTKFNAGEYNNRFEIAQLEAIAHKCVLILNKVHGESCYMPDGTRWIDIPNFAIWFDEKNPEKCAEEIIKLSNDKELRDLYTKNCYDFAKQNFDISAFTEHFNEIFAESKSICEDKKILNETLKKYLKYRHTEVINCLDLLENKVTMRIKQKFFEIKDSWKE